MQHNDLQNFVVVVSVLDMGQLTGKASLCAPLLVDRKEETQSALNVGRFKRLHASTTDDQTATGAPVVIIPCTAGNSRFF